MWSRHRQFTRASRLCGFSRPSRMSDATMRRDIRTDWTVREDVKAKLHASVKRSLRKHGYPPDKQPEAIQPVM